MTEHRIILESSGEHLNLASLMKQCDVLLGDVTVFHKLAVIGGYYEVEVSKMRLNGLILSGRMYVRRFKFESTDRFGREVEETPVVIKNHGLLECLGLGSLFGKKPVIVEEEKPESVEPPNFVKQWELAIPENDILTEAILYLDSKTLEQAIPTALFATVKVALMYKFGICFKNELLKELLDPLLKCLYQDWDGLLNF